MTFSSQHQDAKHKASFGWMIVVAAALYCTAITAHAQTFQVLHTFSGGGDGSNPYAGLTADGAGNFFGTTESGGSRRHGTVFKLKNTGSGWILNTLYSFNSGNNDGGEPQARVAIGPDGALYGTTTDGGPYDVGTIYKLTPPATFCHSVSCPWTETILHTFPDPFSTDGFYPSGDLTFDQAGNLYGTTNSGGSGMPYGCAGLGCGVVYQVARLQGTWTENIVHEFTGGSDGGNPYAGVLLDPSGNIIGSASDGGVDGFGLVFQLATSGWQEITLYQFHLATDGRSPGGLVQDAAGNLYGITGVGGYNDSGTVYELVPGNGSWNFELIYPFPPESQPASPLTRDGAGNLYGTTFEGGAYNYGMVFKLTHSGGTWTVTSLHDFTGGSDGFDPDGQLVLDGNGNIFGTAHAGGGGPCTRGCGVIYEITP